MSKVVPTFAARRLECAPAGPDDLAGRASHCHTALRVEWLTFDTHGGARCRPVALVPSASQTH